MNAASQALHAVIGPDSPHIDPLHACIRATIIFVVGIVYIRLVGPRTFGRGTPLDIVVSVIIGSNLSRAIVGSAAFVPTLLATLALVLLHWVFAHATHRWPWLSRLIKGEPKDLARDGRVDERMLARHAISRGDLEEALRDKGVAGPDAVARAVLERGGQISVLRR